MAATCVAILRSVRTQWEDMVVFVPEGTGPRVWDFHVWVSDQCSLFYRTPQYLTSRNNLNFILLFRRRRMSANTEPLRSPVP